MVNWVVDLDLGRIVARLSRRSFMSVVNAAMSVRTPVSSSILDGRSTSILVATSVARPPVQVSKIGPKTNRRAKGSAMKMISKPNPNHQYIDMTSTAVRNTNGTA